jgi:enterochelin esterase-like enzyme
MLTWKETTPTVSAKTPITIVAEWLGGLGFVHNSRRDPRLDLLRGFAVFAMLVDHIGGQSPLYLLTGGDQFFTSSAEGFVAISGFLVGQVYRQLAAAHGLGVALRRLLERAWLLYVFAVGLTLVIVPVTRLFDLPWPLSNDVQDPRSLLWGILTLRQTAYLADIALLYALLLGVSPLAFILLFEGRAWLVLGISWGLWAVYQVNAGAAELPWLIGDNRVFHFSAWQVLFISAMVLGYHRDRLRQQLHIGWDVPLLLVTGAGVAGMVTLYATNADARAAVTDPSSWWLAKNTMGPARIAASVLVFGCAWLLVSRFWIPAQRMLGWLLLPLGRNSLFAYSTHVLIVLVLGVQASLLSHLTDEGSPSALFDGSGTANALLQVGSVATVWVVIRLKACWPDWNPRSTWLTGPGPLVVAATLLLWANPAQGQVASSASSASLPTSQSAPPVNPLGTPIPSEQVAAIARELGTSANAKPTREPVAASAANPTLTPAPAELSSVAPTVPLPLSTPSAGPALPGRAWTDSTGPSNATLKGMLRQVQFHSQALERDLSYLIYLPPSYGLESRRYPVVYLLHGASQRMDEWLSYGVAQAADQMIASNQIRPMLIVMPLGDMGYWVNHVDEGERWGDYVTADVVQHVDTEFRTEPEGKARAIGGISMGGYGALVLAFNHPQLFQHVAANSPSLHPEGSLSILGTGEDYAQRDPVSLGDTADLGGLGIWLDIGASDPWLPRATQLDQTLNKRGVVHNWTLGDGGHDGAYWQRNVPAYLRFYSAGFN